MNTSPKEGMDVAYTNLMRYIEVKARAYLIDSTSSPYMQGDSGYRAEISSSIEEILQLIGGGQAKEVYRDYLRKADALGSILDRRCTSILGGDYSYLRPGNTRVIKNVFDTDREKRIDTVGSNGSGDTLKLFLKLLHKLVQEVQQVFEEKYMDDQGLGRVVGATLGYHLLYFYSEPIWIVSGGKVVPNDPRIPLYTVFDHASAITSALNLVYGGGKDGDGDGGYLVRIDIGGIQQFILASRKVRDLWASSYIISMLIWGAIRPLILVFGPDILLTPTARFNPIYHFQLNLWIKQLLGDEGLSSYIKTLQNTGKMDKGSCLPNFFLNLYGKHIWGTVNLCNLEAPPYALIPAILTLVLPPIDVLEEGLQLLLDIDDYSSTNGPSHSSHQLLSPSMRRVIKKKLEVLSSGQVESYEAFVENLIESLIRAVWRDAYLEAMEAASTSSLRDDTRGWLRDVVEWLLTKADVKDDGALKTRAISDIRRYLLCVKEGPPLIIRVGASRFSSRYRGILDRHLRRPNDPESYGLTQLLLEAMNEDIRRRFEEKYSLRETPYAYRSITRLVDAVYRCRRGGYSNEIALGIVVRRKGGTSGRLRVKIELIKDRGFDFCTTCSVLPAVIHFHRDLGHSSPYILEGEKLCPICLYKRLVGVRGDSLRGFVKVVFGSETVKPRVPTVISTSDVANRFLGERLANQWKKISKRDKNLGRLDIDRCFNGIEEWLCRKDSSILVTFEDHDMPLGLRRRVSAGEDSKACELLNSWLRILGEDFGIDGEPQIYLYYGIFITDADRIGKIVSGELFRARTVRSCNPRESSSFSEELKFYINYLIKSLNISREEGVGDLLYRAVKTVGDVLEEERPWEYGHSSVDLGNLVRNIISRLDSNGYGDIPLGKLLYSILVFFFKPDLLGGAGSITYRYSPRIVPTPSYLASLSKALMISLLNDVDVVASGGGLVVYAGGDDLFALLPLARPDFEKKCVGENFLDIMMRVRKFYSLGEDNGFFGMGQGYPVSMLYGLGRSQVLLMTHYRAHLGMATNISHRLLEEMAKDGSRWVLRRGCNKYLERDGLVIASYSGGHLDPHQIPILPCMIPTENGGYEPIHTQIKRLYELIYGDLENTGEEEYRGCTGGLLSHSFLRDYIKNFRILLSAREVSSDLHNNIIRRLVNRNLTTPGDGGASKLGVGHISAPDLLLLELDNPEVSRSWIRYYLGGEGDGLRIGGLDMLVEMLLRMEVVRRRADLRWRRCTES